VNVPRRQIAVYGLFLQERVRIGQCWGVAGDPRDTNVVRRSTVVRRVELGPHHERDIYRDQRPRFPPPPAGSALIVQRPPGRERFGGGLHLLFLDIDGDLLGIHYGFDTLVRAYEAAAEAAEVRAEEWQVVSEPYGTAPVISDNLLQQLMSVPTSNTGMNEVRPCCVRLRDGSWRDCVYIEELEHHLDWDLEWPLSDREDAPSFGDVVEIRESPRRLPPSIANALYDAGESAMGGSWFVLVTRSGQRIPCETAYWVDFIDLPEGVAPSDIVAAEPHADEARTSLNRVHALGTHWSVYEARA
jgi:hypothetical protein